MILIPPAYCGKTGIVKKEIVEGEKERKVDKKNERTWGETSLL